MHLSTLHAYTTADLSLAYRHLSACTSAHPLPHTPHPTRHAAIHARVRRQRVEHGALASLNSNLGHFLGDLGNLRVAVELLVVSVLVVLRLKSQPQLPAYHSPPRGQYSRSAQACARYPTPPRSSPPRPRTSRHHSRTGPFQSCLSTCRRRAAAAWPYWQLPPRPPSLPSGSSSMRRTSRA